MVKLIKRNTSKRGKKSVKKRSKKAGTPGMGYIPQDYATKHVDNVIENENVPVTTSYKQYPTQTEYEEAKEAFILANNPTGEQLRQWQRDNKGPLFGKARKFLSKLSGFSRGGKRKTRKSRKSKKSRKSRRTRRR